MMCMNHHIRHPFLMCPFMQSPSDWCTWFCWTDVPILGQGLQAPADFSLSMCNYTLLLHPAVHNKHTKDYIHTHMCKLNSKCFDNMKGMKYLKGDKEHQYTATDFKYDMKHRYLEYVHMGFEVKLPQRHTNPILLCQANHECDAAYCMTLPCSCQLGPSHSATLRCLNVQTETDGLKLSGPSSLCCANLTAGCASPGPLPPTRYLTVALCTRINLLPLPCQLGPKHASA